MPTIQFTYALKRFYPGIDKLEVQAANVGEVVDLVEQHYPGLKAYLVDDQGSLRKHVNIFVDGSLIKDRIELMDAVHENSEVYIMQALSGG